MKKNITLLTLILFTTLLQAQNWGEYTLVARQNQTSASLINLAKATVKTWTGVGGTGYSAYVLPDGSLLRSVSNTANVFSGGGMTGKIQKINANNVTTWDYTYSTSVYCMHHDICPMPNGNVLIISYEAKTAAEATAAGASNSIVVWSEKIVELQPTGLNTANIVWEWKLWDHLAQSVDVTKANYVTSIVNNPQLLNINYNLQKDWVHMNGIDYNPTTDQIVVSSHNLNEMWLIDHSTTTAQAASHTGGSSGKGGDFLYRWGNPAAYSATGATVFNVVHDAHWVTDGPYAGYFAAFNNKGVTTSQSSIDYIQPNYTLTLGQAYLPATYSARQSGFGYTSNMGNSQQLSNGNTLVCVATAGNIYELNSAGTIIWTHNTGGTTPQARRYDAAYICGTLPTASASASQTLVCPSTSVSLNANGTGTNPTYTWSSSPASFTSTSATPSVTPTATTTYTVVVSSGICTTTSSVIVTVNAKPNITITPSKTAVCNGGTVTLTANPAGGSGFAYNWSGAGLSGVTQLVNFTPQSTGAYTVTVTNSAGCSNTATQNLTVNNLPTVNPIAAQASVCQGSSSSLNANASGGTSFTYNWSSSPFIFASTSATPSISPAANTTYSVVVTNNNNCSATGSVSVNVNATPTAYAGNDVTIAQGASTTLSASGGTSYAWSNGTNTAMNSVTPNATTTYFVTVTDTNGCTATDDVVVTVQGINASASTSQSTICEGSSTQLNVSITGGLGSETYTWSANQGIFTSSSQNPSVTPTTTTTYTVTVTSGILSSVSAVTVNVNAMPSVTVTASSNIICNGTSTQLNATGTNPVTYAWSNGVSTQTQNVTPSITTNYILTVTSNGCSTSTSVNITVNPLPSANAGADVTIAQGNSATLLASGGSAYAWSNGINAATQSVSPNTTTTYIVTVTDANGCSATDQVQITVYSLSANASAAQTNICEGNGTQLNVATTGGIGNNIYTWSANQGNFTSSSQNPNVSPSTTTTYTVTVTSGAVSSISSVTVNVTAKPTANASITPNVICTGQTAQLNVNASGGTNYTFAWSNGASTQSTSVNPSFSSTYYVTVTSNGCSAISNTSITVNPAAAANAGTDVFIDQGNSITLIASGGGSYQWSNGTTTFNNTVSPSTTTTYIVTVTNSSGCTATDEVKVTINPLSANASASANTVCSGASVQLSVNTSGDTGSSSSYLWSSNQASNFSTQRNPTVTPSNTTTYTVVVTNGTQNSSSSVTIYVNQLPSIIITPSQNTVCSGSAVLLNTAIGGTTANTYNWSSNNNFTSTQQNPSVTPLTSATYTVTVTSSGCSAIASTSITVKPKPTASITASLDSICAGATVNLEVIPNNGTNYTYAWQSTPVGLNVLTKNPSVNPTITSTYSVTVNSDGCTTTAAKTIKVNPLPIAKVGADLTINQGETATLIASGGTVYVWNNGATKDTIKVKPSATTTYKVTVTNAKGCSASSQATVSVQGGILSGIASVSSNKICFGDSIQLNVAVTGGIGNNTFAWSSTPAGFSSTLQNPKLKPLANTTYSVTMTSGAQTASSAIDISVNQRPTAFAGADISVVAGQTATLTASGGDTYHWNTGENTKEIKVKPLVYTNYIVTVSDSNGCTATDEVGVFVSKLEVIAVANVPQKLCAGASIQLNALVSGNIGTTTYQWASNPAGFSSTLKNPSVAPTITTVYLITVTNSGIESESSVKVDVLPLPITPSISQKKDTLISSATSGNHWFLGGNALNQDTLARFTPKISGAYQVQAIDANGCKSALSTIFIFTKIGIFDLSENNLLIVFPNPTSGELTLKGDFMQEGGFVIKIYNNQGQLLRQAKNITQLDISELNNQLLHIVLESASAKKYYAKVILYK
jgi:hypothetical protein